MKYQFDKDLQDLCEGNRDIALKAGKRDLLWMTAFAAIALGMTIYFLIDSHAPLGQMVSVTIAASTILLIMVIIDGFSQIEARLAITVTVIDWYEKKKAGELYEKAGEIED